MPAKKQCQSTFSVPQSCNSSSSQRVSVGSQSSFILLPFPFTSLSISSSFPLFFTSIQSSTTLAPFPCFSVLPSSFLPSRLPQSLQISNLPHPGVYPFWRPNCEILSSPKSSKYRLLWVYPQLSIIFHLLPHFTESISMLPPLTPSFVPSLFALSWSLPLSRRLSSASLPVLLRSLLFFSLLSQRPAYIS